MNKNGEYTAAEFQVEYVSPPCPNCHGPRTAEPVPTGTTTVDGEPLYVPGMDNCPECNRPPVEPGEEWRDG